MRSWHPAVQRRAPPGGRVLALAGGQHLAEDHLIDVAGSTPACSIAACSATVPSACAGQRAEAPLKLPTGVRAAETMTMSSMSGSPSRIERQPSAAVCLWPCRRNGTISSRQKAWELRDDRGRAELCAWRLLPCRDRRNDRRHFDRTVARWRPAGADRAAAGRALDLSRLGEKVDAFAAGLVALGLQPGERIGIWSPNNAEWVITQFATAKAGLILVNINPAYRLAELEYALNKVGCRALVTATAFKTSDYVGMVNTLAPELRHS